MSGMAVYNVNHVPVKNTNHSIALCTSYDPGLDQQFDETTPSRREIRHNLRHLEYICTGCGTEKTASQLKACSRCKIARYCSPECQKGDWQTHKLDCIAPSKRDATGHHPDVTLKLAARVGANEFLMDNILLHSILQLELLTKPSNDSKYVVRVTFGTGVADMQQYMARMFSGEGSEQDEQVLLQCNKIDKIPVEEAPPLVQRIEKDKRNKYRQSGGTDPFVVMYFVNEEGNMGVSIHGLPVCEAMLYYMTTNPTMEYRSAMFGTEVMPLNEEAIIKTFNNKVRMDKQNKFKLRSYPNPPRRAEEEEAEVNHDEEAVTAA